MKVKKTKSEVTDIEALISVAKQFNVVKWKQNEGTTDIWRESQRYNFLPMSRLKVA